jgi:cytochrome P450
VRASAAELTWPSPELAERPYLFYERLRRDAPVWRCPLTGDFLVSRWADVVAVTDDPQTFGQYRSGAAVNGMAATDGDGHRAKRAAAQPVLAHRSVAHHAERIRALSAALVAGIPERGRVPFVADFARVLPAQVLCEVLSFPSSDAELLVEWFGIPEGRASRLVSERDLAAGTQRLSAAAAHIQAALLDRLRTPRDDTLSRWLHRVEAPPWQAVEYLSNEILFVLFAGYLPVAHLLTTAVVLLLQHPQVLARASDDRPLVASVVDEALRLDPPIQWLNRVARRDTELAGVEIPAGSTVVVLWGSATRDETVFERPAEFLPGRPESARPQLAFGHGVHRCLGASLARLQARIALETLLEPMSALRLAGQPVDYRVERTPPEVVLEPA